MIDAAFDMRPDERGLVSAVLVHSLFEGFALSLVLTFAHSLFLDSQPVTNLPWVYVAGGIVGFGLNLAYARMEHRLPMATLLKISVALLLVPILVFRVLLEVYDPAPIAMGLLAWYMVMFAAVEARYWELNSVLFDVRQGKRLFGILGLGESVAKVTGFASVPALVHIGGAANLLVAAAISMAMSVVVLHGMLKRHAARLVHIDDHHTHGTIPGAQSDHASGHGRYRRLLLGFAACAIASFTLIEFGFMSQVQSRFHHIEELAPFLGLFFAVAHTLDIGIKALFSGRLIRRFGVGAALVVLPIALLLVAIVIALSPVLFDDGRTLLILFGLNMLVNEIFRGSLSNASFLLLFQPLPPRRRLDVHMSKALGDPVVIAAAGCLLLLVARPGSDTLIRLSYVLMAIMSLWIVVGVLLKGAYVQTIRGSLRRRLLGEGEVELDSETLQELTRTHLRSTKPGEVLYALDLLIKAEAMECDTLLREAAGHPSAEVRKGALRRIETLRSSWGADFARDVMRDEHDASVLGQAARTALILSDGELLESLSPLFDDDRDEVRVGALTGALLAGGLEGIIDAGSRVMSWSRSPDAQRRAIAASVIGNVGIPAFYRPLVPLLHDHDSIVRRAAVVAAGQVRNPALAEVVLAMIDDRSLREVAWQSMAAMGDDTALAVERAWSDDDPLQRRSLLVRLLGRIGTPVATQFLANRIGEPNRLLREEILEALHRSAYRAGDRTDVVMSLVDSEIDDAARNRVLTQALQSRLAGGGQRIVEALENELRAIKRRLILLLSFVFDRHVMERVRDHLSLRTSAHTANAIEILELTVGPALARRIVPIFEFKDVIIPAVSTNINHVTASLGDGLASIIVDPAGGHSSWTRACAIQLASVHVGGDLNASLARAASDSEPIVREAAMLAVSSGPTTPAPTVSARTPIGATIRNVPGGKRSMLSTIDRILTLKSVDIFSETEDATLIDIATILEEVYADEGDAIIRRGEIGTCMYIIHDGRVRVHDGDRTFTEFGPGEIFGELSLLDPEPRSASVTAMVESLLLRLDQEAFYELVYDNPSVSRGIMRVLCRRLRNLNQELMAVVRSDATIQSNGRSTDEH